MKPPKLSLEDIKRGIEFKIVNGPAYIDVSSPQLRNKIRTGVGAIEFLVNIPEEGIMLDEPTKGSKYYRSGSYRIPNSIKRNFIKELASYGLIKEKRKGSGCYVRTDLANNADYIWIPFEVIKTE